MTTDDFHTDAVLSSVLRAGSAEFAARLAPAPVATVRARGDRRRRRRAVTGTALSVALVVAIGGGAIAGLAHVMRPTVVSPPADVAPAPVASASRTTGSATGQATGSACQSLVVPQSEKDAVTAAYRRSQPTLHHIAPAPGGFYYGRCGATYYAATRFLPTAGATLGEQVSLQDEGGAVKYFTRAPGGQWTYVTSDGFPRDARGCAAIKQIPPALATDWADCLQH